MAREERCDIIVIGGGSAAHEAAVAAREAGAERIVMLEKAPEPEFGGNARYSHTGFRFVYDGAGEIRQFIEIDDATFSMFVMPPYTRENFLADLNRVTEGRIDQELATFLVDNSNASLHWMRRKGIRFEHEKPVPVKGKKYFEPGAVIHTVGGGLGQLLQWRDIAAGLGVEIRYESKVTGFHGNERHIEGVRVLTPEGEYDLVGRAVICCSGGFQASAEMRARYLGTFGDLMRVRGSKHDTGEVLNMLIALGAMTAGHWQGAHATPIGAESQDGAIPLRPDGHGNSANRYEYKFGITVNTLGQRFYDEGETKHSYTYAKTGRAVLAQPRGLAHQIFDDTGFKLFREGAYVGAKGFEANTIAELAGKIGLAPEVLEHTVEEFNAACRNDIPFDPGNMDGKCTVGITPKKSNWAVRIEKPPFRAYPIVCGITFTFGGLKINTRAEVVGTSGKPIRGLYASGDVVGLFFHNYPGNTGQTRNVVFSRVAGREAAGRNR
jgi:tricarballylate dehydrogenase